MGLQRMDKLLSDTGRWSRKEAKELIRKGQVLVNGKTVAVSGDLVRGKIPSGEADAGRSGQAGAGAPSANIRPVVLGTGTAAGTVPPADGGGDLRPPLGCAKAARRGKKFPESY